MSRQFRVGDIVDAKDVDAEKFKTPISQVTPGGSLFCVGGHYFFDHELTLNTPVENNRGVEQYKDQFAPWVPFKDVTSRELIPDNDNEKIMMLNVLIFLLPKEKQA